MMDEEMFEKLMISISMGYYPPRLGTRISWEQYGRLVEYICRRKGLEDNSDWDYIVTWSHATPVN